MFNKRASNERKALRAQGMSNIEIEAALLASTRAVIKELIKEYDIQPVTQFSREVELVDLSEYMLFRNSDSDAERFYEQVIRLEGVGDKEVKAEVLNYKEFLTRQSRTLSRLHTLATNGEKKDIEEALIRRDSEAGQLRYRIVRECIAFRQEQVDERLAKGKKTNGLVVEDNYKAILQDLYRTDKYTTRGLSNLTNTGKNTVRNWLKDEEIQDLDDKTNFRSHCTSKMQGGKRVSQLVEFTPFEDICIEEYRRK